MGREEPLLPHSNPTPSITRCISQPDDELHHFRSCLRWMCIDQSDTWRCLVSWALFFLLGIVIPVASHLLREYCEPRGPYDNDDDLVVQLSLTAVSGLAFFCLSASLRKYGLRRFLFLDKIYGETERVRSGYSVALNRSFSILLRFVLPCFVVECGYKVWWYCAEARVIPFLGNSIASEAIACTLELASWIYRTSVFFLMCVLFRSTCHLQILRLQEFTKVFQHESDVKVVLQEHLRIRRQLIVISHRFRKIIFGYLIIVTASQFAALLLTTRPSAVVNLFNTGELVLCSILLVVGLLVFLRSAAKITHKAQSITSLAAKWHVAATIDDFSTNPETPSAEVAAASGQPGFSAAKNDTEEDSDSFDDSDQEHEDTKMVLPLANTISFQKRQALVTYLENNKAGITLFGFVLDRAYLYTIFMFELSLALWLLGKTIGIS